MAEISRFLFAEMAKNHSDVHRVEEESNYMTTSRRELAAAERRAARAWHRADERRRRLLDQLKAEQLEIAELDRILDTLRGKQRSDEIEAA